MKATVNIIALVRLGNNAYGLGETKHTQRNVELMEVDEYVKQYAKDAETETEPVLIEVRVQ